jgi:threonine/homoserine/homoserine lactone efflux protein
VTDFLIIGIILGLSAGFAPGPLLTLVISESLQHGVRSGIKVALAPIISDLPIILLTLFIASKVYSLFSRIAVMCFAFVFLRDGARLLGLM